jgi:aryl-alcohol dehydrogenase-like predicted oxidoreductase
MNKAELGKTGVFVSEVSLGCKLMGSVINRLFFSKGMQPIAYT